jgi:hypothetical protein
VKQLKSLISKVKIETDSRLNKLKRLFKGNNKIKQPKLKSQTGPNLGSIFNRLRHIVLSRTGFLIYIALLSFILLGGFVKYFSIELKPSQLDWNSPITPLVGEEINILLVAYEKNQEYAFVDFDAVISISRYESGHKLLVVNPDFGSSVLGKQVKLRNILNNAIVAGKSPMQALKQANEGLLGLKIDRYIAIDSKQVPALFETLGVEMVALDTVLDKDAGTFTKGESLKGGGLAQYLAAEGKNQLELRMWRQSNFLYGLVEQHTGLSGIPKVILNFDYLLSHIETNLSREEAVDLIAQLYVNKTIQTNYLKSTDSFYIADGSGGMFEASLGAVDRQIRGIFARIEVVKEQARIEIYNAIDVSNVGAKGLAGKNKRLIENLGGNVIRAANSTDYAERTKLYVPDPEKYPNNVNLIRQVLEDKVIIVDGNYPSQHAGELVLVLGSDLIEPTN